MSEYWRFFRSDTSLLTYGLSFSFLSSFGQTFLISLFVPFFLTEFALTNSGFGALYSAATLGSALLLPWAGQWLDRAPLHRFTVGVVVLLSLSALLLAASRHLAFFFLALLGLRLAGQGLSSHAAQTSMARYFEAARGKALSISGLGFPAGEAVLPFVAASSIAYLGWRGSWVLVAAVAGVLFAPMLVSLLRRSGVELDPRLLAATAGAGTRTVPGAPGPVTVPRAAGPVASSGGATATGQPPPEGSRSSGHGARARHVSSVPEGARDWRRREVLRDPRFWALLPAALLPAFWVTGFFLYQTSIAEMKGWSLALMASTFAAFAAFRIVTSLAAGGAIDRVSAQRIFPFVPMPIAVGFALLLVSDAVWTAYAFMGFLGVSMGLAGAAKSALWAELYGIRFLGSIKAMLAAFMVLSSAASPVLVGAVMDGFGTFNALVAGGIASVVVASALAVRALPDAGLSETPSAPRP